MRTLVIETATAACSIALIEGPDVIARAHDVVGRGHAERLVSMIADLPEGGRADGVLVDCGPGSFTGIRVGLAAALGLSLGWHADLAGFSSLAIVAAAGIAQRGAALAVVLEGGHGEVFMQAYSSMLVPLAPLVSLKPADAVAAIGGLPAIGNGVRHLIAVDPSIDAVDTLPDAADAVLLPARLRDLPPRPIYGRAPDAKPASPR
ncbi:tRNA (adenosine(37)-N6)-threonylcarbamoyltransferase complex dimerization subunit type 1 TsaB [Sphingomonas bacterium]|uniref:tRNA (adenosine(37)-N6)-threonylcarbamoyltransferase complex dimerization subunit type 1 TsaB n=1 Tax=Sphingomonas bacterium TaxID=1895847 RepID=UPI001576B3B1|nr:tRNA (adenosine(37)-N6)-threonylcarbamoyltransferase complex dimerization subunit type 1 TsaB [Sphingomonas bacterium]